MAEICVHGATVKFEMPVDKQYQFLPASLPPITGGAQQLLTVGGGLALVEKDIKNWIAKLTLQYMHQTVPFVGGAAAVTGATIEKLSEATMADTFVLTKDSIITLDINFTAPAQAPPPNGPDPKPPADKFKLVFVNSGQTIGETV